MPEINLLDNNQIDTGDAVSSIARNVARLFLLLVVAAIIGYGVLFFLSYRVQGQVDETTASIKTKQTAIEGNKDRSEIVTRQGQIKEFNGLVDNHLYWSYLIPELARVTLNSGKYTVIQADSDGKLNLTVSLPSYADIEKYMQIFDLPEYNQQFSNVRIVNITKNQNGSKIETLLTLQLTFNPEFIKGRM